jgi:hypothetical protein
MKVSAVILTYNEEGNIARCLQSLAWCDDILVVDSGSTDGTLALCAQYGARVMHNPWVNFSTQRNWALANGDLRYQWVLHLDADEEVTPEFRTAVEQLVPPAGIHGYRIPSRTILFGKWLRRSGMYPVYQVRLGDRDLCIFHEHGHGQRENLPASQVATLDTPYNHYAFSHGLRNWFVKHVGYARAEADQILQSRTEAVAPDEADQLSSTNRRRAMKRMANRLPPLARPPARFFYMTVLRMGFLDGRVGLYYCVMNALYEAMIALFLIERRFAARNIKP